MTQEHEVKALREALCKVEEEVGALRNRLESLEEGKSVPQPAIPAEEPPAPDEPAVIPVETEAEVAKPAADDIVPPLPKAPEVQLRPTYPDLKPAPVRPPVKKSPPKEDSLEKFIKAFIKFISPKEKMSWEMALGTHWLPRIAVVFMAIGVTWLVTLAIKHFGGSYMAHIRVFFGYLICAALLGIGKWLEKKTPDYARVLMAGGLAMGYFVTFATHYFQYTRIFSSPEPTLLALCVIVVVWAVLAHWRGSVVLGAGMVILGELTLAAATLTSLDTHQYAPAGFLILAAGGMFFMIRRNWYHIGALTMAATQFNLALWFFKAPHTGTLAAFIGAMTLLAAHFLIFAGGEYFSAGKGKAHPVPGRLRRWYVTVNSAVFFALGLLTMRNFDFARSYEYLYYALLATSLLGIGLAYYRRKPQDPLFNVFFVKASALYVLALADYFDGATLTLSLTLEAFVLLVSARQWRLPVNRILALAVTVLALGQGIYTGLHASPEAFGSSAYFAQILPAFMSIVAFLGLSLLYQRTDWMAQNLSLSEVPQRWQRTAWEFHLLKEAPINGRKRLNQGQFFSHAYALAASILTLAFTHVFFAEGYRGAGLSIAALIWVLAAIGLLSKSLFLSTLPLSAVAILLFHLPLADSGLEFSWTPALLCWIPFLLLSEIAQRLYRNQDPPWIRMEDFEKSFGKQFSFWSCFYLVCALELYIVGARELLPEAYWVMATTLLALAATAYALFAAAPLFSIAALAFMGIAGFYARWDLWHSSSLTAMFIGGAAAWGTALFSEHWFKEKREPLIAHQMIAGPYAFYGLASFITLAYLWRDHNTLLDSLTVSAAGVALLALMPFLHRWAITCCATALLVWGIGAWIVHDSQPTTFLWHGLGILLPIIALVADRYLEQIKVFIENFPGRLLIVCSAAGLLRYSYGFSSVHDWWPFWAALTGMFFLGHAVLFKEKTSVAVSLVIGAVMTLYHINVSYTKPYDTLPVAMGYGAFFLLWLGWERAYVLGDRPLNLEIDGVFSAVMGLLLCLLCHHLPALKEYYLTIGWSVSAVALFVLAVAIRQKYLRYTGFAIFLLSLGRIFLIDTQHLEPIFRIVAIIFLSTVMLFVAYGYVYARKKIAAQKEG